MRALPQRRTAATGSVCRSSCGNTMSLAAAKVRRGHYQRWAAVVVCLLVVGVAGCGSTRPRRAAKTSLNNCGSAYTLTGGRTSVATPCSGSIGKPLHVRVRAHEHFTIRHLTEDSGQRDFPTLRPANGVVRLTASHGAVATYVVEHMGSAKLVGRSRYCPSGRGGTCAVFWVFAR